MVTARTHVYMYLKVWKHAILVCAVAISTVGAGLILPITTILTGRVFDLLATLSQYEDRHSLYHELTLRSMSIMGLGGVSLVFSWVSISSWMFVGETQGFTIRKRILKSLITKSPQWLDENGEISGRFTQLNRCVEELRAASGETSAIISRSIVTMAGLIGTSFYYSWSLTLVTMCSAPIIIGIAVFFSSLVEKNVVLENEHTSRASRILSWSMSAAQLVKLSCTQLKEVSKFREHVKKSKGSFVKICTYSAANTAVLKFLALTMFVQAFWFGSTMIRKGRLSVGDVVTCFHSCILLGATINGILHQLVTLQKGRVAVKHIFQFLQPSNHQITSVYVDATDQDALKGDIEFKNVSFAYPCRADATVLKDVSLKFASGETTFVIGKSGSGKSTLSNILLKFYEDYDGIITINGKDARYLDQNWLTQNITMVEQRCTLFNDTMRRNILFGSRSTDADIDNKNLKAACRMSLLEQFIFDMPDGLDTLIGSGGVSLSGGQQQRLAVARAFMRDPPILILDEAMSALDTVHRTLLSKAVRKWREGKTTIILTHDLSQIGSDDFLVLIENGKCVEKGTQRALLNDVTSKFYQCMHIKDCIDNQDNVSQLTTVETHDKEGFLESFVELDVETPKVEEHSGFFPDTEDLKFANTCSGERSRMKANRITVEDKIVEQGIDKAPRKRDDIKLMSVSSVIRKMFNANQCKHLLVAGIMFSVIAGAANPIFSYTFSFLLNGIVPQGNGVGSRLYLLKWSFITMGVACVDALSGFLKDFLLGYCGENWIMNLRNEAMSKIIFKEFDWFLQENNKESETSSLVLNDLRDLRSLVTEFLGAISTFLTVSFLGLIWAVISGWKLSLVCISMFPLMIAFSALYGALLQKYETEYKTAVADLENLLYEIMTGVKTIRCLQIEQHFYEKYCKLEHNMKKISMRRAIATGFGIASTESLTTCIQAILFYYALKLVIDGEYTSQRMFETFTLLLFTIMTCSNLINCVPDISRGQRAATCLHRILEEEGHEEQIIQHDSRCTPINLQGSSPSALISIRNLTFSYPSAPTVSIYKGLDLDFFGCKTIAVVGESGSGKSTLVYLLTKLYKAEPRSVFIDGTDVNDWRLHDLRRQIAVVEQKPSLFCGTIRENLTYGIAQDTLEIEIYDMLKYVGIFDFVFTLSNGVDTIVSSNLLSGGQAQRLCIARALLRKPKILILDECTSALDPASSHIINELVRKGPPTLLTISITHCEEMMKSCEEVVVIKKGRVVEQGPFGELIKEKSALYYQLASCS